METALPEVSTEVAPALPVAENALPEEGSTTAPPGPASEIPADGSLGSWQPVEAEPDNGPTVASFIEVDYSEL